MIDELQVIECFFLLMIQTIYFMFHSLITIYKIIYLENF